MVPPTQSLMNPHGSPTGMSWVALAHTKLPPSQKHEVPSAGQSCNSGLQESRHRLIDPLLAIEHEVPGSHCGLSGLPVQNGVQVPRPSAPTSQHQLSAPQSSVDSTALAYMHGSPGWPSPPTCTHLLASQVPPLLA